MAGLYVLARFDGSVPDAGPSVKCLPKEIIYVGMSKNLNNRPLRGAHHGAKRYQRTHNDPRCSRLYISIFPVYAAEQPTVAMRRRWYRLTKYLEMKVHWEYTRQHKEPPATQIGKVRRSRS